MLIYLDSDLGGPGIPSARTFDGINNLALSAKEGKHVLLGTPQTLSTLLRHSQLNQTCRDVFRRVSQTFYSWAGLQANVSLWLNVSAGATSTPTSRVQGVQRIVDVHPEFFDDSSKVQPSVILAENRVDGVILEMMARCYLEQAKFGPCRHVGEIRSGGGSTIEPELQALASINKPVICIVDSDRKFPSAPLGGTASSVQTFKDIHQFPLVEVVETAGRDMENALPDQFFEQAYGSDPNHVQTTKSLRELSANGQRLVRRHVDLKKGTLLSDGFAAPQGHADRQAWESAIETTIAPEANFDLSTNNCWQAKGCQDLSNCTCRVLNGNSDNMLAAFVKMAGTWSKGEMGRAISSADNSEWIRLGRLVFDWTCAAPVLRA